jgi:hypothetical protein
MQKSWDKIIRDEASPQHVHSILNMAQLELAKRQARPQRLWFKNWVMPFAGAIVAATMVLFMIVPNLQQQHNSGDLALMSVDPEDLENMDLLLELDDMEELEEVEQWQET